MKNSTEREFEDLIIGYISQSLSINDLKKILEKLKKPKNIKIFKAFIKINYYSIYIMNQSDTESIIKEVKSRIKREESKITRSHFFQNTLKYAAVFCLIFGLGYYSNNNYVSKHEVEKIIPKANDIVLSSGNNTVILENENENENEKIEDKKIISKINLIQKEDQLIYDNNIDIKELVYHNLKVPYGKRFNIVFSDGSKVYLNSGSVIKYPIKFIENKKREVFLEGEAFFDVAENKNDMFLVNSKGIKVEVYGTKFNVRNYTEDFNSDIVLVEGSVGINNSEILEQTILKPGFKGSVNKENFKVTTSKVNTKIYTSWIDGEVIFRNETFNQILKKLERLYNVTIINNKNKSSNELFNAAINVENENIEQVLEYFNKIYNIDYQTFNNKIIIN